MSKTREEIISLCLTLGMRLTVFAFFVYAFIQHDAYEMALWGSLVVVGALRDEARLIVKAIDKLSGKTT